MIIKVRANVRVIGTWVALIIVVTTVGCGSGVPVIVQPNYIVTNVKTNHGIFKAQWYITIKNTGGSGSMLVQYWVGSNDSQKSRKIIYSDRHTLSSWEEKTITVTWGHGGLGAITSAVIFGGSDGVEFLP